MSPASAAAQPTREQAAEAARQELARHEYADAQPPLLLRALGRVVRWVGQLFDGVQLGPGSGLVAQLLLTALLLGLATVLLVRLGPLRRRAPGAGAVFGDGGALPAEQHRAQAEQAAAQGRWADAVRERLRAVVRELEARGVLDVRPGRTAGEVARDGGAAVPELAPDLRRAAGVFDEVWYGGREAGAGAYDVLVQVDDRVRAARLVSS